jgi:hypothetical protein
MNAEVTSGSRSLKSLNTLISATLVCAVLAAAAALAGYFLQIGLLYLVAGALALGAVIPCFLMFQRVKVVELDIGHREALSLAQRKETERNQQAILRLLDELAPLADGDLTVQATVTEDITGTIADSINYAIGVLRDLVATINQSAIQLDGATRQTQALGCHRISRQHGGQHRGNLRQLRARLGRGPSFGGRGPQGWRRRASHHRRHEHDPRDHPGDLQAHQAPG